MADKVKPLKLENPSTGGTESDIFPTETNPSEDYLAAKGIAFENSDSRLIDLSGSGHIQFTDAIETTPVTVRQLRTSGNNIFTPADDISETDVQSAVLKANRFGSYTNRASSTSETSTSSTTTFSTKVTLTTSSLTSGNYLLFWRFQWRASNANRGIEYRIRRASSDVYIAKHFSASSSDTPGVSSFIPFSSISGVQTITLDWRVGIGATTIFVKEAYLELWRHS